jgi:hypothetical protein
LIFLLYFPDFQQFNLTMSTIMDLKTPGSFSGAGIDCCAASPENYKVLCELPGVARLVEMTMVRKIFPSIAQ